MATRRTGGRRVRRANRPTGEVSLAGDRMVKEVEKLVFGGLKGAAWNEQRRRVDECVDAYEEKCLARENLEPQRQRHRDTAAMVKALLATAAALPEG